jgi:hypothetical protein
LERQIKNKKEPLPIDTDNFLLEAIKEREDFMVRHERQMQRIQMEKQMAIQRRIDD